MTSRQQQVTGWYFGPATTTAATAALTTPAVAGNALVAVIAVDKSSGAFGAAPSGWTTLAAIPGTQISLLVLGKIAVGGETSVTAAWTTTQTRYATILAEYSGVASFGPVHAPAYSDTARTSMALGPVTATGAGKALAVFAIDSLNGALTGLQPAATGWTTPVTSVDPTLGSGTPAVALDERTAAATSGEVIPSTTFTWTESDQTAGVLLTLVDATSTPTLISRLVGIPGTTDARLKTRTADAATVRLKIGTNSAVTTGVVFSAAVTPDGQGIAAHTPTGLAAGTRYYYRVAMTPSGGTEVLDTAGTVGSFKTAPAGQANFAFDFASCCDAADSAAMAAIAARGDDLFFHLGDLYYNDGGSTALSSFRDQMDAKIAATNHAAVFATTATSYTPSDHDGMANNSYAEVDATAWTAWNAAYRERFPLPTMPGGSGGAYYTFTWGRVRFVQIDERSFKTASTALGATQKQWLKDTITAATEPVIVILQSSTWIGTGDTDSWSMNAAERTELAAFFTASGKQIGMLGGDMHAVAADDGTNAPGGIFVFQAAPLSNAASIKGGPYAAGPYPASGSAAVEQYGRCVVTDSGSSISLAFTGYSSDDTARVTLTTTFSTTRTGSAGGSWTFAGTAAGARTPEGSASGAWAFTGAGSGKRTPQGSGSGAWSFTGSGTGQTTRSGSGTGTVTYAGSGTGTRQSSGSGVGLVAWTGTGAGAAPGVGGASGSGTGTWTFTGSGSGARASRGTGAGAWAYVGTGAGIAPGQFRDITLTVGPGRSRHLAATGTSRELAAAGASRTLTAEPLE